MTVIHSPFSARIVTGVPADRVLMISAVMDGPLRKFTPSMLMVPAVPPVLPADWSASSIST